MTPLSIESHVTYALRNAFLATWPFPHFIVGNVFPYEFYEEMRKRLSYKMDYRSGQNNYNGRLFADDLYEFPELAFMESEGFLKNVAKIFAPYIRQRFAGQQSISFRSDLRLIRDGKDYFIGPHTDAPWKVVSLLFYLPPDSWNRDCGTSFYVPKDANFTCAGGPHYPFEGFDRVCTVSYDPNTCLGFFKTDSSFHGVEKIDKEIQRDVLLFNIYAEDVSSKLPKPAGE